MYSSTGSEDRVVFRNDYAEGFKATRPLPVRNM